MQVILKADVNKVGAAGTLANVSDGYARNFLFPRDLAVEATPGKLAAWKEEQAHKQAKEAKKREEAEQAKKNIQGKSARVEAKAGENGKLFGSVTNKEVADALKEQYGIELEKNRILLEENIKSFGSYELRCKLGYEVSGTIHLLVVEA